MRTPIRILLLMAWACHGFLNTAMAQSLPDSSKPSRLYLADSVLILEKDSSVSSEPPRLLHKSHLEAGISYQNNDVYLGRKDSTVLPYYIPSLSYYHKSGLFAIVSLNYLKNATDSRIDLLTLEGGYMFTTGNYEGQFTASKYFYSAQSTNVASEIEASLAYENSYDFGFIRPSITATLNVGKKMDFEGLFSLEHCFYFLGDQGDITPTIAAAGSTQNYYDAYYQNRRFNIKKLQKTQPNIVSITGSVLDASSFKILDFEPTLPINYRLGKCTLNFSPTYSIPLNPAIVTIKTSMANGNVLTRTRSEKIENTFYWTLGFSFLF